MNLEELEKHLQKVMIEQNRSGLQRFEGYSPIEINELLYDPLGDKSPLQIQKLSNEDYTRIPIFN
jgi:hypothetical protein